MRRRVNRLAAGLGRERVDELLAGAVGRHVAGVEVDRAARREGIAELGKLNLRRRGLQGAARHRVGAELQRAIGAVRNDVDRGIA